MSLMKSLIRNMKSYTDLEQSQKLAEILPPESADMEYLLEHWIDEKTGRHKEEYYKIPVVKVDDDCPGQQITLPCWTLAALLSVFSLPRLMLDEQEDGWRGWFVSHYTDDYRYDSDYTDEPIDACYNLILQLKEKNLL